MASRQQTLWDWAEQSADHDARRIKPHVKGKLSLGELPAAPARQMFDKIRQARQLHLELEARLGRLDLHLTNNRRRMISARRKRAASPRAYYDVRLHHMFLGCEQTLLNHLVGFIRGEDQAGDPVRRYIQRHREAICYEVEAERLTTLGQFHDLEWLKARASRLLGDPEALCGVQITWGRRGRGKRTIRLGSYDFEQRLVRIHPSLDQRVVPSFFIEYIVYHELLHALYPPIEDASGRRCVHTEEFKRMETRYPLYHEALAWEASSLHELLEEG